MPENREALSDQSWSGAMTVGCPTCQAPAGVRCRTLTSGLMCGAPHILRSEAAEVLAEVARLRAANGRLTYTLTEITARNWLENALDPQWAARLARARLEQEVRLALASDDKRRAHDELHGCWECGTSDMRGNVCAEHEGGRRPSREQGLAKTPENSEET